MKIFYLPDLGEGLAEAEIREWHVKEGDVVTVDQPLVSMETAKALVEVPSPYAGKIVKRHGDINDIIQTGAPLITFESDEVEGEAPKKGSVVGALEESAGKWIEHEVMVGNKKDRTSNGVKALPAARVLAKEWGVDLQKIAGSGPGGLITVDDVKKSSAEARESNKPSVKKSGGVSFAGEALHGVRRAMAQIMTQSHAEIVPVTLIEDADISQLESGADLSVLLLQAMVAAVKVEPALNAWFDGSQLQRKLFTEVNIGLATDTDEGLFVPVIKEAQQLSTQALRAKIDEYKTGAKERSIASSDLQGATITFSNFGTIAGRYATPIIVPPMVAILASGRSRPSAIVREGQITAGKILPLSLTFDHRAVTGGEATRFLAAVIKFLQEC